MFHLSIWFDVRHWIVLMELDVNISWWQDGHWATMAWMT
jgi:hypothetical protein